MCGRKREIQEKSQFSVRKAVSRHFERSAENPEPPRVSAAPSAKIVTLGGTRFRISQHPYHPLGLKPDNGVGAGFNPARIREGVNRPEADKSLPYIISFHKVGRAPKTRSPLHLAAQRGSPVSYFFFCLLLSVSCLLTSVFFFFHSSTIPTFHYSLFLVRLPQERRDTGRRSGDGRGPSFTHAGHRTSNTHQTGGDPLPG